MNTNRLQHILLMAVRYLAHRKLATLASIFAIAISLMFVVSVGVVNFSIKRTAVEGSIRYPLVIGPGNASGVQLVMSTIFHLDKPTGTIPFSVYEELKSDPRVIAAFPIAVADSLQNYPLVGTSEAFLKDLGAGTAVGAIDLSKPENAVLGHEVAERLGLGLGDGFFGSHGMTGGEHAHVHDNMQYKVVGILNATGGPEDTAIYTNYETVWLIHKTAHHHDADEDHEEAAHHHEADHHQDAHEHHGEAAHHHDADEQHDEADEHDKAEHHGEADHEAAHPEHDKYHLSDGTLTAVLVRTSNPVNTAFLEREWTLKSGTQGVDTARGIRRLVGYMNKGERFVGAFGSLTLLIAIVMILVTLVMSLNERRRELALLRSLGIGRLTLSLIVMAEVLVITLAGSAMGVAAGHLIVYFGSGWIDATFGIRVEPFVLTAMERWALLATLIAGQALAGIGMIWTYRMNVIEEIAKD